MSYNDTHAQLFTHMHTHTHNINNKLYISQAELINLLLNCETSTSVLYREYYYCVHI